jgi:hypothetical protein
VELVVVTAVQTEHLMLVALVAQAVVAVKVVILLVLELVIKAVIRP